MAQSWVLLLRLLAVAAVVVYVAADDESDECNDKLNMEDCKDLSQKKNCGCLWLTCSRDGQDPKDNFRACLNIPPGSTNYKDPIGQPNLCSTYNSKTFDMPSTCVANDSLPPAAVAAIVAVSVLVVAGFFVCWVRLYNRKKGHPPFNVPSALRKPLLGSKH